MYPEFQSPWFLAFTKWWKCAALHGFGYFVRSSQNKVPSKSESELKVTSPDKISGNDSGELARITKGVNNELLFRII